MRHQRIAFRVHLWPGLSGDAQTADEEVAATVRNSRCVEMAVFVRPDELERISGAEKRAQRATATRTTYQCPPTCPRRGGGRSRRRAMGRDRWFRGDDQAAAFDWQRSARELGVAVEFARDLYARAMQRAVEPQRVQELYLRWLRDAVAIQQSATTSPVPGRRTQVMHEARSVDVPSNGRSSSVSVQASGPGAPRGERRRFPFAGAR